MSLQNFFDQTVDGLGLHQQDPFAQEQSFAFPLPSSTLPTTTSPHTSPQSRTQPPHQTAPQPPEYEPCFIHADQPANYHRTYILQPSSTLEKQRIQLQKLNDQLQRRNNNQTREISELKKAISTQSETSKVQFESLNSEIVTLRRSIESTESQVESCKKEMQKMESAIKGLSEGLTAFSNFMQVRMG